MAEPAPPVKEPTRFMPTGSGSEEDTTPIPIPEIPKGPEAPAPSTKTAMEQAIEDAKNKSAAATLPGTKPTQAESAGALRKMWQEEKERADALEEQHKNFTGLFGESKPEDVQSLWAQVSDNIGDGDVSEFFSGVAKTREEIDAIKVSVQEKEDTIKKLNIQHSQEFKTKALAPLEQSNELFGSLFAGHPEAASLQSQILGAQSLTEVRDIVSRDDILAPMYLQIAQSRQDVLDKQAAASQFVKDWDSHQEQSLKDQQIKAARDQAALQEAGRLSRKQDLAKASKEIGTFDFAGVVEPEEVTEILGSVDSHVESILAGTADEGLDVGYQRSFYGEFFRKHGANILKELSEARAELEKIKGSGPKGQSAPGGPTPPGAIPPGEGKTEMQRAIDAAM